MNRSTFARIAGAVILGCLATGAVAGDAERPPRYSALDTLRRAKVGTFSPALREEDRRRFAPVEDRSRREDFVPRWGVTCEPDPAKPGTLKCEERK